MLTDFLKLTLTAESETGMTFLEWRTLMNGVDCNSNMELIDGALARLDRLNAGKADGFTLDPETGVLQLTSYGEPIDGASVTINLNKYYTKAEVDAFLKGIDDDIAAVTADFNETISGYYTKEEIDTTISGLEEDISAYESRLDGYYTKAEVDTAISSVNGSIEEISDDVSAINNKFDNYYTKDQVDDSLSILEDSVANNDTILSIQQAAVGNLDWSESDRTLTMYNLNGEQIGDGIVIEGGSGGGGGSTYSIRLLNGMPSTTFSTATSSKTVLKATFYEYYGTVETGVAGTLSVSYKLSTGSEWTTLSEGTSVMPGVEFTVDVTNILKTDATTNVKLTVIGGESELPKSLTYNITQVEASVSAVNFDDTAVYAGNFDFVYRCVGRGLEKTMHFVIDGEEALSVDVGTSHNTNLTQTIPMLGNYSYGAHEMLVYFTTADGASSNVLTFAILYDDGTGTDPMIGVVAERTEVTYGDTIGARYVLYTPDQETTDELTVRVYATTDFGEVEYVTSSLENIPNNVAYTWQTTNYPDSGVTYIEFKSGKTVETIQVLVNEIETEYNLHPVATNLVYQYSAAGRSNNDANKEVYEHSYTTAAGVTTKVKGLFNDFNWVSNGYVDGTSLMLSGEARHTIQLPIFSTSYVDDDGQTVNLESATGATVTTNGRTIEFEFTVNNVTDINAEIIRCMSSDHAGFLVTPQVCYLLSSNGPNVALDETGFIENEESIAAAYIKDGTRIRLSIVIEPKGSVQYTATDGTPMSGQCANIYINGQYANSFVYPDNARFAQSEYITIGSDTCILNVYDVRIYNRGLTSDEIMQNYMASPLSVQDRLIRFEDNDVLTDDGDVDYYSAIKKYNCMLVTGPLSPYKGADGPMSSRDGKYECGLTLTKPNGSGGFVTEFDLLGKDLDGVWLCSNNVQGTSSQKFPIKNYKFYLAKPEQKEDGTIGSKKVKYALKGKDENGNDLSIGESTLCWKADYMSSDHANTFNANLADTLFIDKTPAQEENPLVQNTIYGFRCLLFQRDDVDSPIRFAGDGALNNDKGNSKSFGLEDGSDKGADTKCQKWEFLNNTEALCSFLTDRLMEPVVVEGGTQLRVTQGLESTYPDQGDLKDEGLTPNYEHIQVLYTWVCQRANFWNASTEPLDAPLTYGGVEYTTERDYRKAIFVAEFDRHFNRNHALTYYLFMEFVALCDNRAKNMFLQCFDVRSEQILNTSGETMSIMDAIDLTTGEVNADMVDWENSTFAVWYPVLYDLDSCFGVENSGYMQIPYYADWNYQLNGTQKFNGRESVFWLMFEEAMAGDIMSTAQTLTDKTVGDGALNYDALYDYHIKNNALLVCPAVVNRDMEYKHHDPWIDGFVDYSQEGNPVRHISDYKYMQRGSRTQQKDAYIFRRANMIYSKYKCSKFLNNNINFRCGTDGGVPASQSGITVEASQALFPAVKFGDGDAAVISAAKTDAGTPVTITKPSTSSADKVGFSDTIYIAGGTFLTDIGDISKFRPYELQLQNATGLRKLTIGSAEEGYVNASLKSIDTSGCKILEEINIMGCSSLGTVDLSKNGIIKRVLAANSSASSIMLPNGGVLEELTIGSVSDLCVLNQSNLETFACDSYDAITSLRIENTPNIPTLDIVAERLPYLTGGLRLIGIDWTVPDTSLLETLISSVAQGKYIDNNGVLSENTAAYPYISGVVHCDTIGSYLANMLNSIYPDLEIDALNTIPQYSVDFVNWDGTLLDRQYVYRGDDAVDPIYREENPIPVPTRPSTASTIYTFESWDGKMTQISADTVITAKYSESLQRYTVRWYNGSTLLQTVETDYGTSVEYTGDTPTDASGEGYLTFKLFDGWDNNTYFVDRDIDAHAKFTEAVAPTDKALSDMNPTELYALVRTGVLSPEGNNNTIIASGDTIDIILGKDYDFDNVESKEFISVGSPVIFDGTNHINTGVKLFDEDKAFVLAIDFEFSSTENNSILASCLEGDGFSLKYNSNPIVQLGTARATVSSGTAREIVVIRKMAGSNDLHVYASSRANAELSYTKLAGGATISHNAPLSFGANVLSDGYVGSYASGTIHWAKLWMGDLGDTICRNLASWTRSVTTFEAAGSSEYKYRMFKTEGNTKYVNCCFLMKDLLDVYHQMSDAYSNVGGWPVTSLRTWLNSRVLSAIPDQWVLIMQKALVSSTIGDASTEIATVADYLWIPSSKEVGFDVNIDAYAGESEDTFSIFTDYGSVIKHFGGPGGVANRWWLRSPYFTDDVNAKDKYFRTVEASGGVSLGYPPERNGIGVCFGFCI